MMTADRKTHDRAKVCRHIALAVVVATPAAHRTVCTEHDRMEQARAKLGYGAKIARDIDLLKLIVPPRPHHLRLDAD